MAITLLEKRAKELSTFGIVGTFTGDDGDPMTITLLTWTLSTCDGTIINSRNDVAVASPVSPTTIVLNGADLAILEAEEQMGIVRRRFTFKGEYTSSDHGSGLPMKDECIFEIQPLVNVS